MNQAQFAGRVGRDATLRETPTGRAVLTFPLAVDVYSRDPEHKTLWVNCSLWGARAEKLHPHIQKGITLAVSGEVTLRSWSKNGREGTALELQASHLTLLGRPEPAPAPKAPEGLAAARASVPNDPFNDDIPF